MALRIKKLWLFPCSLLLLCLSFKVHLCKESDTISPGQSLSGNQTLTSSDGNFELGFFTPNNSRNHYIGIWYKKLPNQTVVWVANREHPVSNPSFSELRLLENGNLVLLNQSKIAVWSANSTSKGSNFTRAMLLDNGNFVVRDGLESIIWQSFDHPTNTWLPGGKIGYNKLTNVRYALTSWRSLQNPALSRFSVEVERNGTSHLLLWNGSQRYWSSGEWTGKIFTLVPEIQLNYYVTNMTYVTNENESYFTYASAIPSAFTRFVLDVSGQLRQFTWRKDFARWGLFWTRPTEQCDVYAFCGAFGICNQQKEPLCACTEGFEPKTPADWELNDHTDGCVRKVPLKCDNGRKDKFLIMPDMSLTSNSELVAAETIEDCQLACLNNCSCNAFAYDTECLIWKGDLFNLQQHLPDEKIRRNIHLRIASSTPILQTGGKAKKNTTWIIAVSVAGFFSALALVLLILWRSQSASRHEAVEDSLMLYKYKELRKATKNFSGKLGAGGFGTVFKGTLSNSTAIAVKQLISLQQGEKQFITEVKTIGTIQHINLVRLRGFCVESLKRFLVYDYMPNGSLETLLFKSSAKTLDWKSRYHIAIGTARGLAYLHEGCRDCIIHCDIKPENILLDAEYNPKVADLGLAKIMGRDFSRVLTTVRGTRGYLAPEWISGEAVTPKADAFSYGMLLFEIISGKRNSEYFDDGTEDYFPFQLASIVNKEEDVLASLDGRLAGNANIEELNRACKVACWCIQDDEKDRPSLKQVVQILEGVSEIGIPSVPRFLQSFAENQAEPVFFLESLSNSDLLA